MPSSPDIVVLDEHRFLPVHVSDLRDWWQAILPALDRLLAEQKEYRAVDILDALTDHRMQLWASGDSFVITQVGEYPTLRVLTVLYAGGNLETIRRYMGDLEAWARDRNCDEIRVQGRPGWERVFHMEQLGFVLRKEL